MQNSFICLVQLLLMARQAATANLPATMRSVRAGLCEKPFTKCVKLVEVPLPDLKSGEVLIAVNGSSVNPSDVDTVEAGGCILGCGNDVAGTVVGCNKCRRLKLGDQVWGLAHPSFADFVATPEVQVSLKPREIPMGQAGTIPEVGLTSLFSLKRTGSLPGTPMPPGVPSQWRSKQNLTVLITAGSGGTGFIGVEIAKAYGAKHIATATTGADAIAFVKRLGATYVTDYKSEDIFDSLPADSIDFVYDNYGAEGTADKAMRVLRRGGTYLLMPHGECYLKKTQGPPCLSSHPKPGVTQVNYVTAPDYTQYGLQGLQELTKLFEAGQLSTQIAKTFQLADMGLAFNYSAGTGQGGVSSNHFGKIAIIP